ncbi:FAD/FMN-binding family oxidoreductase (macronuclear) [Tetrahymena thermophila SB210]|uniref:FAD/FMN-binding family oxidoreductase n=1 Tax=Tetrahymena thermophila (strain SB210) TaxID=312017 RepID=Q22W50_TETTS|nr:FAD/FMN-binding family oxidoreductase [Tetrahymena thermophila SB210]EAR89567.1 FAD/FMN-binding family oxidoreductase [Tetrahymena thermophila SB210]|eukprot:XP_001009812.1 FAD/FMN-binding family oxidoreductase [Tetrahymena thermophila SB210]
MGCGSSQQTNQVVPIVKKVNNLFQATKVGSIEVKNRFVMTAISKLQIEPQADQQEDYLTDYYTERSGFGLIFAEYDQITPLASSFYGSEHMDEQEEQIEEWRRLIDIVHQKGAKIVLQLWHPGRAVLRKFNGGDQPIAPSPIAIRTRNQEILESYPIPKEMDIQDIQEVVQQFREGAIHAKKAGFDGVLLNAADGYLVDQFIKDGTNSRNDEYGGNIQKRCKFLFECLDALTGVYGADKVGVKFSPTGRANDMYDSNPLQLMKYILSECERKKIAFVEIKKHSQLELVKNSGEQVDQFGQISPNKQIPNFFEEMRNAYSGTIIANDSLSYEQGTQYLAQRTFDLINFVQYTIVNPDLVDRFKHGWEVAKSDYSPQIQIRNKRRSQRSSIFGFEKVITINQ